VSVDILSACPWISDSHSVTCLTAFELRFDRSTMLLEIPSVRSHDHQQLISACYARCFTCMVSADPVSSDVPCPASDSAPRYSMFPNMLQRLQRVGRRFPTLGPYLVASAER
jgi:hypothetical protein